MVMTRARKKPVRPAPAVLLGEPGMGEAQRPVAQAGMARQPGTEGRVARPRPVDRAAAGRLDRAAAARLDRAAAAAIAWVRCT